MKIKALNYKTYGKLENVTLNFSPTLNILYGENETGKSTVFNSIRTLIYGFKPANRTNHPYVSWQRGEIDFSAEVEVSEKCFEVTRQLKSAPKLTILEQGENTLEQRRNEALPWVTNISDDLYDTVWHLTPEMLLAFETKSWEQIQEKLIFNYGVDYLNKGSDVVAKIQQELGEIWKSSRRGNPRLTAIEQEIITLEREKNALLSQYNQVQQFTSQIAELTDSIEKTEKSRKMHQEMLQEIYKLIPIKKRFEKIQILKQEIQNKDLYENLPHDALQRYKQLDEKLKENLLEIESLEAESENVKQSLVRFSDEEIRLLDNAEKILASENTLQQYEICEQQLGELTVLFSQKHEAIEREITNLFEEPYDIAYEAMKHVNPLDVKTVFYHYMDLKQKEELERVRHWESASNKRNLFIGLLVVSVLFVLIGIMSPLSFLTWVGFVAFGISIGNLKPVKRREVSLPKDLTDLRSEISLKIAPLKIPDYVWEDKTFIFTSKIETVSTLIFDAEKLGERIAKEKLKRMSIEGEMRDALHGIDHGDHPQIVLTLQIALQKLKHLKSLVLENDEKLRQVNRLEQRLQGVKARYDLLKLEYDALELKFLNLGMGRLEEGISIFERNQGIVQRLRTFEEEMLSEIDLYEQFKRYDHPELIHENYVKTLENLRDELEETRKRDFAQRLALMQEVDRLKNSINLDEVDSKIMILTEEGSQLEIRKNQLLVMSELLQFSDEHFRRENQPDILNRVSKFMAKMTRGKYQRVLVSDNFELQFLVNGEIMPISMAFSKGTLNQLFLAFRLALIEMLCEGDLSLPLVLDEAFINWDHQRLAETLDVLQTFAQRHQVIIFTCHPELFQKDLHLIPLV